MDEDELRIGKKRRSSDPAVALAEEAVRMQHEVMVELRKKAATRIAEDAAARKAADKDKPVPDEQRKAAADEKTDKREATPPERTVPRNPDTTSKLDIEA